MIGLGREERPPSAVGALLRQTRIALGQSIAEVARDVRIRQTFIEAIESGRFAQLPGGAYTIGFIRTYSEHLGLEANEVVRRFKLETGAKAPAAKLNFPSPLGESGVPKGAILLIGAVIALLGYGIWYVSSSRYLDVAELTLPLPEHLRQMLPGQGAGGAAGTPDRAAGALPKVEVAIEAPADRRPPAMTATPGVIPGATPPAAAGNVGGATPGAPASPAAEPAPSPPPASPPSPSAAASGVAGEPVRSTTAPPEAAEPAGTPSQSAPPSAPAGATPASAATAGRVVLRATTDTWVEIRDPADRAIVFSRLMRPGETFAVPDRPGLLLRTGNAGGLEAVIDGVPGGALGKPGIVRRNVSLDADALRGSLTSSE